MKKIILGSIAVFSVLGLAGASVAATNDDESAQAGGPVANGVTAKSVHINKCDGGVQKAVYNRTVNQVSLSGEGADFVVPGVSMSLGGPHKGKDTLSVEFSAETQLRGNTAGDLFDWGELEILLDGVKIQPAGPASDPMALTGSSTYAMNAAQFCVKIGPGPHDIDVVTRIVDNGTDDALSLWLDDYTLHVERSN